MEQIITTEIKAPSKKEIITKLELEIIELNKKVSSLESSLKWSNESRDNATNELSDVHEFLDGFDYVLPHLKKDGYSRNKLATRLMSFFIKAKE